MSAPKEIAEFVMLYGYGSAAKHKKAPALFSAGALV